MTAANFPIIFSTSSCMLCTVSCVSDMSNSVAVIRSASLSSTSFTITCTLSASLSDSLGLLEPPLWLDANWARGLAVFAGLSEASLALFARVSSTASSECFSLKVFKFRPKGSTDPLGVSSPRGGEDGPLDRRLEREDSEPPDLTPSIKAPMLTVLATALCATAVSFPAPGPGDAARGERLPATACMAAAMCVGESGSAKGLAEPRRGVMGP
mmetsp:Transcript_40835/g.116781  ORF Transcript_40835/g.116781 Transcript_40835/m.116781 type:complete len:212 (+) Transcript_40835:901-1536(+)